VTKNRSTTLDGYKPQNEGYKPIAKGYQPQATRPSNVQGGYRPTTGQGPTSAPTTVPNQPSSVQPPKK
jgi:hypothetical protein